MTKLQFRVLYRQFLFRMVDLELLSISAQGDISKLLGQFAGLLVFFSFALTFGALIFDRARLTPARLQSALWGMEHFLISTTLLVVGLFAVLSWDSTFPDRRDVLVLAPLPIRARTLFLAKVTAAVSALSLTVVAMHCLAGLGWPFHFVPKGGHGLRSLAAYWVTMFSAGAFNFGCVLGVEGLAAQVLARRYFLRLSAFLQMAAFSLFLSAYLMEPTIVTPSGFAAAQNQWALEWLPSYWFLGFFHQLNGSMQPEFVALARRAWIGLAVSVFGTAIAYAWSYFRTLRKIVEEPDIVPGSGAHWLPPLGNLLETSVVQFSIRTLARSRQHRVMLAFFLGIGFALLAFVIKSPGPKAATPGSELPMLFATVAVMCITVVGTRVVFSMPISLRANWIFRVTQVSPAREYMAAIRRPLFVLAVLPVWILSAALLFSIWPWWLAADHLVVLGLLGSTVAYACLTAFRKIPFTCSYLPGKSYLHMAFLTAAFLMLLIVRGVVFESAALRNPTSYAAMVTVLAVAALVARWWAVSRGNEVDAVVQFEEVPAPVLQTLGLNRDGVVTTEAPVRLERA
jgi:hypothetical protein